MAKLSRYKTSKLLHEYYNWETPTNITKKYKIAFTELYKLRDKSRLFDYITEDWIYKRRCSNCMNNKPYTTEFFRKKWDRLQTTCKTCKSRIEKNKRIIDKRTGKTKTRKYKKRDRAEYQREYLSKNKNRINKRRRELYNLKKRQEILRSLFLKRLNFILIIYVICLKTK